MRGRGSIGAVVLVIVLSAATGGAQAQGSKSAVIHGETCQVSADGYLMPVKKDQPPPDLKYFKPGTQ
jgi:hypothetical protein